MISTLFPGSLFTDGMLNWESSRRRDGHPCIFFRQRCPETGVVAWKPTLQCSSVSWGRDHSRIDCILERQAQQAIVQNYSTKYCNTIIPFLPKIQGCHNPPNKVHGHMCPLSMAVAGNIHCAARTSNHIDSGNLRSRDPLLICTYLSLSSNRDRHIYRTKPLRGSRRAVDTHIYLRIHRACV